MIRLAFVLAVVACSKKQEPLPAPVEKMSAAETQRSQDACKAYVEQICTCATKLTGVAKQCELARALPEAIRIDLEVAASPDSKPDVVSQALAGVRKTAKECIEQTAKLPTLGCP